MIKLIGPSAKAKLFRLTARSFGLMINYRGFDCFRTREKMLSFGSMDFNLCPNFRIFISMHSPALLQEVRAVWLKDK